MFNTELIWLWYLSLGMAGFSISFMIALIINRIISTHFRNQRRDRRIALVEHLLITEKSDADKEVLGALTRSSTVIAQTIAEISTMVRGEAFQEMLHRLEVCNAESRLIRLLKSQTPRRRMVAAEALAFYPKPEVREALWNAYKRPAQASHRIIIAQSIISAGAKPELADFFEYLDLNNSDNVSDMASLFNSIALQDPEPITRRASIAYDPPYIRATLLKTLGNTGTFDAMPIFVRDAADPSPEIRAAAIDAIGALGFLPEQDVLDAALGDEAHEVRAEAAETVGLLLADKYFDRLIELVSDADWDVRFRAAKALSFFGERGLDALETIAALPAETIGTRTAQLTLNEVRGV